MGPNYIALAIPFFFILMGIELLAARLLRRRIYRLSDAFSDLGCGVAQQLVTFAWTASLVGAYVFLYDGFRLITPSETVGWIVAFVGVDFFYYWWHRASHRVNLFWAAHVVHHQSEDMNLAVALRQAILTSLTIWPFYAPLAFLGVPIKALAAAASFNTLYQFWIHTELVPKLGPLEWILNTPSAHRVHHGINPIYLDKNYGGTLIIWDRLFGTYEPETEPCVYGTVKPFGSFDPLWAQVAPLVALAKESWRATHFVDRLLIWVMPPPWRPRNLEPYPEPPSVHPETFKKYDMPTSSRLGVSVFFQLVLALGATTVVIFKRGEWPGLFVVLVSGLILVAFAAGAALIEGRRWAWFAALPGDARGSTLSP